MTRTIRQGAVDFSVAHKVQTTWGSQEALTFALEGIGAVLFFACLVTGETGGALAGLAILVAAGLLLMAHLGSPKNAIYLLANIRHSWMSRGAALIPLYMGLGFAVLAARALLGIPLDGLIGIGLEVVFLLLTIFVVLKSGLVLSTFPAIPFWTGGLLPVLFALNGIASGLALYWVLAFDRLAGVAWALPVVFAALLALQLVYLATMRHAGGAARVSVALIGERYATAFWGAGIFGGLVLPLVLGLIAVLLPGAGSAVLFGLIALLRIVGDIAARDVMLKVGVYEKVF